MEQSRLNHLMMLSTCKSQLDQIDLIEIASTIVDKNEGQRCTFGRLVSCQKFIFHIFFLQKLVQFV